MFKQIFAAFFVYCCIFLPVAAAEEQTAAEKERQRLRERIVRYLLDHGQQRVTVTGLATLPDGKPASGMKIGGWGRSIPHPNCGDGWFETTTDENGRFTLSLFQPHLYWLTIDDPNGQNVAFDRHFELKEQPPEDFVRFQLQKGIPVTGVVMDAEKKEPIAGLPVWLMHQPVFISYREMREKNLIAEHEKTQQFYRETRTDAQGRFRFAALPVEYMVSPSEFYGFFRPTPQEELDLYARFIDAEKGAVDVRLEIPSPWQGQLLQKDGTPAAFYPVVVDAVDRACSCVTDKDGRFTTYKPLEVESIAVDTPDQGQWFFKKFDKKILPQHSVFQLNTPLTAKGRLVRKSTGKPLTQFKFACRPRPYNTDMATTDEQGYFELTNLFLDSEVNLCYLNKPDELDTCALYEAFHRFTPREPDTVFELGTLELEESGWLDPNTLQNLPGKTVEIEGMTLDGQELDWKNYQGKVVLVDFWATWCGPCLAEIPHLKSVCEKYRDRGFEIIGINVDADLTALEKGLAKHEFPWTILVDEKLKQAAKTTMCGRFGISEIPRCILVGRDGKVISIEARGEKLDAELEKLFPK